MPLEINRIGFGKPRKMEKPAMPGVFCGKLRGSGAVLFAVAIAFVGFQTTRAQQETSESMLTYSRGQAVMPAYEGWYPNPDGTFDLWFGYLNQNYREEPDIPIGPDNNVSPQPYGPDVGQATHFLPRNNRWVFKVRVPKDFGDKEVVWTLTSHGKTHRAYATLKPGYIHDEIGMQREYFGEPPAGGNKPPVLRIEGDTSRAVKVGQTATLTAILTDDGQPPPGIRGGGGASRTNVIPSICGPNPTPFSCGEPNERAGSMFIIRGLRMGCFLHRGGPDVRARGDFGNAALVTFDPRQEKMWEDHRGGSPWATGYVYPPLPKDNTLVIRTSFKEPGTYVVRCLAHDGLLQTPQDITFTVTP